MQTLNTTQIHQVSGGMDLLNFTVVSGLGIAAGMGLRYLNPMASTIVGGLGLAAAMYKGDAAFEKFSLAACAFAIGTMSDMLLG